ncbi:hypothetical protein [Lactiplantibacillus plantarum]|uniref:hypothetical protein n=1 Tax=Lactiplantibacillus plantarum TaxID=1590 RepID=UPI001AAECCCE|nr:hypothetical protein [Lactiplantibacillus plantarum]MBO2724800.1 hypothetical protein [Lactiplantibacillus plantarum]
MKRINHEKLNSLVCEVEDRHKNGILDASAKEMAPIWKITKIPATYGRKPVVVDKIQCALIKEYDIKRIHTSDEKDSVLDKLGKDYSWLSRRLHEYRLDKLKVED